MKQLNFTVNSYYFIFNIVLHSQKKKNVNKNYTIYLFNSLESAMYK